MSQGLAVLCVSLLAGYPVSLLPDTTEWPVASPTHLSQPSPVEPSPGPPVAKAVVEAILTGIWRKNVFGKKQYTTKALR